MIPARVVAPALAAALLLWAGAGPASATTSPTSTTGPCGYTETPEEPAARPVGCRRTRADAGPRHGDGHPGHEPGPIPVTLDRAQAPCTVQSFLHLNRHRFYNFTTCHRLTAYPTLKVLQCGDPSGTGERGPGLPVQGRAADDLPPGPDDPTGERKVYARGMLAMANAGPDTNGSQFFLVYGDSALPELHRLRPRPSARAAHPRPRRRRRRRPDPRGPRTRRRRPRQAHGDPAGALTVPWRSRDDDGEDLHRRGRPRRGRRVLLPGAPVHRGRAELADGEADCGCQRALPDPAA